jgi:hypothetical protein
VGGTLLHIQKLLQYINISYLNSILLPFSFIPLSPFLEQFQQVSFFHLHTFMHRYALYSPSHALSPPPPCSHWHQHPTPGRTWFHPPVLWFCKWKKMTFLFQIATQGASLRHFHIYMYYNPNRFISSTFLLSTLVSLLWWLQQV